MIIDTHAHLDGDAYDNDRQEVIQRARDNGVDYILNIGCDLESSCRSVELTEQYDFIYATAGIHPHEVKNINGNTYTGIRKLLAHPKVLALGEIGLDYYRNHSPPEIQRLHFRKQIELAREIRKPIIVHCRGANDDVAAILSEYYSNNDGQSGIFHCFSGGQALADKALRMGFYISFAGTVTFQKSENLRDVVKTIPAERLFVETDSPYLAPAPHRGKRNEPSYVGRTAEKVAEISGLKTNDIQRSTSLNFFNLFGVGQSAKVGTIAYQIRNSLYLNITTRCTNSCVFCARLTNPIVQGYSLKLDREPTAEEVWKAIDDPKKYDEVVFCGYGEPTLRLDVVKEVGKKLKAAGARVRLNTNGHGNVINKRNILPELAGLIDEVSVSLNADSSAAYDKICVPLPSFQNRIYDKVLEFIEEAKKYVPKVQATIVTHQGGVDEKRCEDIAKTQFEVNYRPRHLNIVG